MSFNEDAWFARVEGLFNGNLEPETHACIPLAKEFFNAPDSWHQSMNDKLVLAEEMRLMADPSLLFDVLADVYQARDMWRANGDAFLESPCGPLAPHTSIAMDVLNFLLELLGDLRAMEEAGILPARESAGGVEGGGNAHMNIPMMDGRDERGFDRGHQGPLRSSPLGGEQFFGATYGGERVPQMPFGGASGSGLQFRGASPRARGFGDSPFGEPSRSGGRFGAPEFPPGGRQFGDTPFPERFPGGANFGGAQFDGGPFGEGRYMGGTPGGGRFGESPFRGFFH